MLEVNLKIYIIFGYKPVGISIDLNLVPVRALADHLVLAVLGNLCHDARICGSAGTDIDRNHALADGGILNTESRCQLQCSVAGCQIILVDPSGDITGFDLYPFSFGLEDLCCTTSV